LGGVPGRLLAELRACETTPDQIDIVFLTHSHPDHVGWNFAEDGSPLFPKARYVLSEKEWDFVEQRIASNAPLAGAMQRYLAPLGKLPNLELLQGETSLTDSVTAIETPGHTPGHMSLIIASLGEKACITGDAIVHPALVTNPHWSVRMDFESVLAVQTRNSLVDRLEAEGIKLVGCHFPNPGYGQVIRIEGRRYWQAL
jgi:glyoxylase-like metal-dependent hydrolase (beta-lactamase superfamily II)